MTPAASPPGSSPAGDTRWTGAYLRLCGVDPTEAGPLTGRPVGAIQDDFEAWATALSPDEPGESPLEQSARARAQVLLAEVPARWPAHFLQRPPPPELAAAVRAVALQRMRPFRQTSMSPQPIDLGPLSEVAQGTWETFDTWPVLRGLTTWFLFALLLGAVFYVVRF